jgi:hypothetical protein
MEFLHVPVSLCVVSFRGCAVSGDGVTEGGWLCWHVGVVAGYLSFVVVYFLLEDGRMTKTCSSISSKINLQ